MTTLPHPPTTLNVWSDQVDGTRHGTPVDVSDPDGNLLATLTPMWSDDDGIRWDIDAAEDLTSDQVMRLAEVLRVVVLRTPNPTTATTD